MCVIKFMKLHTIKITYLQYLISYTNYVSKLQSQKWRRFLNSLRYNFRELDTF